MTEICTCHHTLGELTHLCGSSESALFVTGSFVLLASTHQVTWLPSFLDSPISASSHHRRAKIIGIEAPPHAAIMWLLGIQTLAPRYPHSKWKSAFFHPARSIAFENLFKSISWRWELLPAKHCFLLKTRLNNGNFLNMSFKRAYALSQIGIIFHTFLNWSLPCKEMINLLTFSLC